MDKENIDRREVLEIYNQCARCFSVWHSPYTLGEAYVCSVFLGIPFDLFLSDVGLTEDEFMYYL